MNEEIEKNKTRGLCPKCPTYNDCMKNDAGVLFCFSGKSGCPIKSNGCICGGCPVYKENNFKGGYYCIHGKE